MEKRALISVSEKIGIVEFARRLVALGWEIVSTGGTAKVLRAAGLAVTEVADVTGFPEMMGGRVKTLHPKVHGGILARRNEPQDMAEAVRHEVGMIDLVVVNLYPFQQTAAKPGVTFAEVVEQIDIGGPALLRSAAKNHQFVIAVVNPGDYGAVLDELERTGEVSPETRERLAVEVFSRTADYDAAIRDYMLRAMVRRQKSMEG